MVLCETGYRCNPASPITAPSELKRHTLQQTLKPLHVLINMSRKKLLVYPKAITNPRAIPIDNNVF